MTAFICTPVVYRENDMSTATHLFHEINLDWVTRLLETIAELRKTRERLGFGSVFESTLLSHKWTNVNRTWVTIDHVDDMVVTDILNRTEVRLWDLCLPALIVDHTGRVRSEEGMIMGVETITIEFPENRDAQTKATTWFKAYDEDNEGHVETFQITEMVLKSFRGMLKKGTEK